MNPDREALLAEKDEYLKRIEDNWTDPFKRLAHNRFDVHDSFVKEIRRIDGELANLA